MWARPSYSASPEARTPLTVPTPHRPGTPTLRAKVAIPHKRLTQASTDTQNLQPETPLRDASWSRGKDQIQRHRPPQPTAA